MLTAGSMETARISVKEENTSNRNQKTAREEKLGIEKDGRALIAAL
jgi:hypothetical protein